MAEALEHFIRGYFNSNNKLTKDYLVKSIKKDFPNWTNNTINIYLSKQKKDGLITTCSRGIYKFESKSHFQPKISNLIQKEFDNINLCSWDTAWIDGLVVLNSISHYIVIEVQKETSELVIKLLFETMRTEKEFIMKSMMENFNVNKLKMHRYSVRSNGEKEIQTPLKTCLPTKLRTN